MKTREQKIFKTKFLMTSLQQDEKLANYLSFTNY